MRAHCLLMHTCLHAVEWKGGDGGGSVRFASREDLPPEASLGPVLQILLDGGQWIRELRRGRSLEERFLELTQADGRN